MKLNFKVKAFVRDECIKDDTSVTLVNELYKRYIRFCDEKVIKKCCVERFVLALLDINIDADGGWGDGGWDWDHPIAGGIAVGAAIGIGARMFALPYGCSPYYVSYYSCGGVYYQPQYEGDTVVYVTVDDPATTTTVVQTP